MKWTDDFALKLIRVRAFYSQLAVPSFKQIVDSAFSGEDWEIFQGIRSWWSARLASCM